MLKLETRLYSLSASSNSYSACVRTCMQVLNFSWDKIFVVNVQPAKTVNIFSLENFRLYGIDYTVYIIYDITKNGCEYEYEFEFQ